MDYETASAFLNRRFRTERVVYRTVPLSALEPWGRALVQTYLVDVPGVTWEYATFESQPRKPSNVDLGPYTLRALVNGKPQWLLDAFPATGQFEWWDADRTKKVDPDDISNALIRLRFPGVKVERLRFPGIEKEATTVTTPEGAGFTVVDLRTDAEKEAPSWPDKEK